MNVSLDHSLASEAADTADPGSSHRDVSTAFSDVQRCSFSQPPMVQPSLVITEEVHRVVATVHHIQHTGRQSTIARHFRQHHGLVLSLVCLLF